MKEKALFVLSLVVCSCLFFISCEKKHPWVGKRITEVVPGNEYEYWGGTAGGEYGLEYLVRTFKKPTQDYISLALFVNREDDIILQVLELDKPEEGLFYTYENIIDHKNDTRKQYLILAKEKAEPLYPGDEHLFEIDAVKMFTWDYSKNKVAEVEFIPEMEIDYYMP